MKNVFEGHEFAEKIYYVKGKKHTGIELSQGEQYELLKENNRLVREQKDIETNGR